MKTTLDLPDELMKSVKIRAVRENRKLKDMVADLLRLGLAAEGGSPQVRRRARLPLVRCTRPAILAEEMTPERVATVLKDEESRAVGG